VAIVLLRARPDWRAGELIAAVLVFAAAANGYYNFRVTGNPLQMPFTEYASQYSYIPLFNFQPLNPVKAWHTPVMRDGGLLIALAARER
jgi:hypothetical protein